MDSVSYYKSFSIYRIEKKLSVQDHAKLKDYAKQKLYFYIVHEPQDNNKFLFISSKHYEEQTKLNSAIFNIRTMTNNENLQLKILNSRFGVRYYDIINTKGDIQIIFNEIVQSKTKDGNFYSKYKIHKKKIFLENPDWYLDEIKRSQVKNYKKKFDNLLFYNNEYNEQIKNHAISTYFILYRSELQRFNDHFIVMDEGKTGKSSLIGYNNEKIDNVSVAGLYGSSDAKLGKFKGGIITTSDKTILIDEINELIENNKQEKILSVLNSILENGTYNYQKQHGQMIYASNQFGFMGNLTESFNLAVFLNATFGNTETIGRRIGVITYNKKLNGFKAGHTRPHKVNTYIKAISIFMSNLLNSFYNNEKMLMKLQTNEKYLKLRATYKVDVYKLINQIEEKTTEAFFKSHTEGFERLFMRSFKLYIYRHLNSFIDGSMKIDNSIRDRIIETTLKEQIALNLQNITNVIDDLKNNPLPDYTQTNNVKSFDRLNNKSKAIIQLFNDNYDLIDMKDGLNYNDLKTKSKELSKIIYHLKERGIDKPTKELSATYYFNITLNKDKEIILRFINKEAFKHKIDGIFNKVEEKIDATKVSKENNLSIDQDII